ncbi:MAG TPA: DUF5597 domain-containing protein [Bacteroidales bacterium]
MKTTFLLRNTIVCTVLLALFSCQTKMKPDVPHLKKQGNVTQLIVRGKPFLILGGEVHNSSSSSLDYMKPVWPKLAKMHLNTVLVPLSWEQFEPTEGKYDYSLVDGLISDARQHNLRIVFLWLATWKNGNSTYAAGWVKTDQKRFPLVKDKDGNTLEILSTLGEETCKADSRAFTALMKHIRETDAERQTVLMIQVENEVGMHSDSRDRSDVANQAFAQAVPQDLMDYLQKHKENLLPELLDVWKTTNYRTSGTWEEVFGQSPAADEIFMAWNYARFINRVAEAGKAEYSLPMYVNAWLVQPQDKVPGDYPSGGPVAHVHDIWRAGAPQIDILSPDIYVPDFNGTVKLYSRGGNPVFIPESRGGNIGAANAFFAIGQYGSIGYSPFGIDKENENSALSGAYSVLSQLSPLILKSQGTGTIGAVSLNRTHSADTLEIADYKICVTIRRNILNLNDKPESGYGMIISIGPDEFIASGNDINITFKPANSDSIAGLLSVEEGKFVNNSWVKGRHLNGDEVQLRYDLGVAAKERQSGAGLQFPSNLFSIQKIKLYKYK